MHRRLQFGVRESPASDRRHGSRLAAGAQSDSRLTQEKDRESHATVALAHGLVDEAHSLTHAAETQSATVRNSETPARLLSVREVASILNVPVSWVYEHTRPRCLVRIPHVRVGKYLRFVERDLAAYVEALRTRS